MVQYGTVRIGSRRFGLAGFSVRPSVDPSAVGYFWESIPTLSVRFPEAAIKLPRGDLLPAQASGGRTAMRAVPRCTMYVQPLRRYGTSVSVWNPFECTWRQISPISLCHRMSFAPLAELRLFGGQPVGTSMAALTPSALISNGRGGLRSTFEGYILER